MTVNNLWVTCTRPRPQAHLRLFCLPCAGGAASMFYAWTDALPQEVKVCSIQLPGRENRLREPPFTRISPLVSALIQALQPYLDKPFALFGHSMGALIGFELARQLRRESCPSPVHLFISGRYAPQAFDRHPPIHHLPEPEFIEGLRRFNGIPDIVLQNNELRELFIPLLRADITLNETYAYVAGEPLDCPISAFGGTEDNAANQDDLAEWRHQTHGAFTLRMLPGDHFFFRANPAPLLEAISEDLDKTLNQVARDTAV